MRSHFFLPAALHMINSAFGLLFTRELDLSCVVYKFKDVNNLYWSVVHMLHDFLAPLILCGCLSHSRASTVPESLFFG